MCELLLLRVSLEVLSAYTHTHTHTHTHTRVHQDHVQCESQESILLLLRKNYTAAFFCFSILELKASMVICVCVYVCVVIFYEQIFDMTWLPMRE